MEELKKEMTAEEQAAKLTADYAELKAKKNPIIEKVREAAKAPKSKPRKEVTVMTDRQKAEHALINACKELKLTAPRRIEAKADSKSGMGALQAFTSVGIKVAVRSNDIVIYMPQTELGYGVAAPGRWACYVTVMKYADPNLDKAFRKALKDKVSSSTWAKQGGFVPRAQGKAQPEDLDAKRKRLEAELEAIKRQVKAVKAKPKQKKTPAVQPEAKPEILGAIATVAATN